jgi:hypothetical protein
MWGGGRDERNTEAESLAERGNDDADNHDEAERCVEVEIWLKAGILDRERVRVLQCKY